MFAATPSLLAVRTAFTIASEWRSEPDGDEDGVLVGDVTQAFVHADVDELIITRVPREMNGMKIKYGSTGDEEVVLCQGTWMIVLTALYGYRRSPKLWQGHFLKTLAELKKVRFLEVRTGHVH